MEDFLKSWNEWNWLDKLYLSLLGKTKMSLGKFSTDFWSCLTGSELNVQVVDVNMNESFLVAPRFVYGVY